MLEPHLRSPVGRRLFIRFLLAALLPLAGVALYAYIQVGNTLTAAAHHRLMLDSKAYGMSLVESLNRHASEFQQAVQEGGLDPVPELAGFASIEWAEKSAGPELGQTGVSLALRPGTAPELRFWSGVQSTLWIGRLDADGFWSKDSRPEHACVFSLQGEALYCTRRLAEAGVPAIPVAASDHNASVGEIQIGGEAFLLGFWRARFLPALDSPGFVVMVATPKSTELASLATYRLVFAAVVLLAIALAVGLSNSQIRQQIAPLLKLQASTKRLSAGQLGARSEVRGDDEFGELGRAFDLMAMRLEQKFEVLGLLSALDRAVLDSASRETVAHTVLSGLSQVLPDAHAGGLMLQPDGSAELLCQQRGESREASGSRIRVDRHCISDLPSGSACHEIPASALPAEALQALCGSSPACLLLFPVLLNRKLDSALLMGFASRPGNFDEIMQLGRSLADRMALSAANIERERRLYQQAHHDALTGLPNRMLLLERLQQAIGHAARNGRALAVLFLDIDRFKQINDTLGHAEGDLLLMEFGARLSRQVRAEATVARLGGDEFVIVIADLAADTAFAAVDRIARDLQSELDSPFQLGLQSVVVSASLGIALYPDNAATPADLLRMADEAMYDSKRRVRGGYGFYTSNITAATRDRFELTQELREAIQRNEFLLHFQPKVDARTGALVGAEALLRWQSPQRGMVLPGRFVHLLDEMGLATWLGEWVLGQACAQMKQWDAQGFPPFRVSINFSPIQFERTPVVVRVREALERHGLSPERIEIEILESMAVNQSREVRDNLSGLRALGVRIALDDFGTGFSSLVHLTEVPADVLKLDRVFTLALCADLRQREIVRSILDIARVMQLEVVAEGVETEVQRNLLPELGCHVLQGYLIGQPVAPENFAQRWLRRLAR
ncbi:putative bifunctional diguanylate cyclase/phosphodiesterase [Aquimonas voraii]|uniref:Diguanylate cyclase (GGDEF) domain-containing protein n=1 Tax=Aquimonas voraii TaxID=265719 RepID=A0A1G6UTE3_9GAMM|nr:EAL domain-containing protein [Aquimonas voraii]SDD44524.1 diguanylate cyclase (GGDEF) domain-containing protein [Aquimonas voraii]